MPNEQVCNIYIELQALHERMKCEPENRTQFGHARQRVKEATFWLRDLIKQDAEMAQAPAGAPVGDRPLPEQEALAGEENVPGSGQAQTKTSNTGQVGENLRYP